MTRGSDVIARFGSDEFVAIAPEMHSIQDIQTYCSRISKCFADPFLINDQIIEQSCSIGISTFPDDSESFEELIELADQDMYRAKAEWHLNNPLT